MELQSALEAVEQVDSEARTRDKRLSNQERTFVAAFITNGGNAKEAAALAGYSHPHVIGCRMLTRQRVVDAIHKLTRRQLHAALPVALGTLVELCRDTEAAWKDRRAAAEAILKLDNAGKATGPSVAVQVNVGRDDPVSEVIQGVWENRAQRLSSIAAPMPDNSPAQNVVDEDG